MSVLLPDSLALLNISDGASIVASDHRNNYSDVQIAVNQLIAALSGGTVGQVLQAINSTTVQWSAGRTVYHKTLAKDVTNTVTETDLLNAEITVGAGVLGTTGMLRCVLLGDVLNNSGGNDGPTIKVKLGGTVFYGQAVQTATSGARRQWALRFEIVNRGAANSQWAGGTLAGDWASSTAPTTGRAFSSGSAHAVIPWGVSSSQAVDTSTAQQLAVTCQWGAASTTRSFQLTDAVVEVV